MFRSGRDCFQLGKIRESYRESITHERNPNVLKLYQTQTRKLPLRENNRRKKNEKLSMFKGYLGNTTCSSAFYTWHAGRGFLHPDQREFEGQREETKSSKILIELLERKKKRDLWSYILRKSFLFYCLQTFSAWF